MRVDEPCGLGFDQLASLADEVVMAHLQSGHGDALRVIFDRYHRLILHVALKILRDTGEAEDLMQSVFLEIYKVAAQFDPARGTTKKWIFRYAYNRSINRRQQLMVRQFYTNTDLESVEETLAMTRNSVLVCNEAQDLVRRGLETLKSEQRRVLELAYFEGLTMKEIAEETGGSHHQVRHHYYRGLKKLREFIREADRASEVPMQRTAQEMSNAKSRIF